MYNRGAYNRQRFNLAYNQDGSFSLEETMAATFGCMITHGEDIYDNTYCIDQFGGTVYVTPAELLAETGMAEAFAVSIIALPEYVTEISLSEAVSASISIGEDSYLPETLSESINADIYLSMDMYTSDDIKAYVEKSIEAACNFLCDVLTLAEIVDCSISSNMYDYKYIYIDVTIPAGGTLIIDSDNFNVLLDGENAIDKQRGDWFDELTRNTFDVTITSGVSGTLDGSLLYTERFL